jgi:ankyrin repeat protein
MTEDTQLHYAAWTKSNVDFPAEIKASEDINAQGHEGRTPLHKAAHTGQKEKVELLLDAGADPDVKTTTGYTALMEAAHYGHHQCCRVLLDHGADASLKDDDGNDAAAWWVWHLFARHSIETLPESSIEHAEKKLSRDPVYQSLLQCTNVTK